MKLKVFSRLMAAGAVLAGTLAGTLAGASPASAMFAPSGIYRCPSGDFCLFTGLDGTGTMTTYRSSQSNLGYVGRHAASWANRTHDYACIYPASGYAITSAYYQTAPWVTGPANRAGFGWDDARDNWRNHFGSVRLAPTGHECGDGHQYVGWGRPYDDPPGTPKPFGSFLGDGQSELLMRSVEGRLWVLPGGSDPRPADLGAGWNSMTALVRHGDLNGDGREDILARDTSGTLWTYPGLGTRLGRRMRVGTGWNSMNAIVGVGDISGDRKTDLIARDTSGNLWFYPGNGRGGFGARHLLARGWSSRTDLVGPGDLTGDGRNDFVARDTSGRLWLYPGSGGGRFGARRLLYSGVPKSWRLFAIGDVDGDLKNDLNAIDGQNLNVLSGNGKGAIRRSPVLWEYPLGMDPREVYF